MAIIAAKIADARAEAEFGVVYTQAMAAYILQSEWVLAVGFVQWVLLFVCGAVWLWWPLGIVGLCVSLRFARLIGNATWDEFPSPLPGSSHD